MIRINTGRFQKGCVPWNKGKTVWYKGQKLTEEHKKKISKATKGRRGTWRGEKLPDYIKEKIRKTLTGHKLSEKTRKRISISLLGVKEDEWLGFASNKRQKYNHSKEHKLWREAIFKRDNYTCVWCGERGYLEADHIQRWCDFPELRLAIDNGRTLCRKCHKRRHFGKTDE